MGGSFFQASEANALDLGGDNIDTKSKTNGLHKWDRQKKKYVGTQVRHKVFPIKARDAS